MRGAAAAALVLGLVACGGRGSPERPPSVAAALRARLDAAHLSYRSVVCLPTVRRYRGAPVRRCVVNFGAPHLVTYCSVLLAGRLLTDHERPEILCGRRVTPASPVG